MVKARTSSTFPFSPKRPSFFSFSRRIASFVSSFEATTSLASLLKFLTMAFAFQISFFLLSPNSWRIFASASLAALFHLFRGLSNFDFHLFMLLLLLFLRRGCCLSSCSRCCPCYWNCASRWFWSCSGFCCCPGFALCHAHSALSSEA